MAQTPKKPAAEAGSKAPARAGAKKAAAKPAGTKRAAGTAGAKAAAGKTVAAGAAAPGEAGLMADVAAIEVKLKALVDRVTEATDASRQQVRVIVEAVLKEMGTALASGHVLNLPGFGKARVTRTAEGPAGTMTVKLRQGGAGGEKAVAGGGAAAPLASPGEDS